MSRPTGRHDEVTPPNGADLRASLRSGNELPGRRSRRQRVDVEGVDGALGPLIEQAVTELAERLGVSRDEVVVEAAGSVTWSDGSAGCPEPDRSYPQVPVDGAYVRLSASGRPFHFHAGGRRSLFLCDG